MGAQLQVLVCTTAGRIGIINTGGWPEVSGVEYLVCCQNPEHLLIGDLAESRNDITVHFFDNKGLSNNRNNALEIATAPYILIADDDTAFRASGLTEIIRRFETDSEPGLLTVKSEEPEESVYPPDGHDIAKPFRFYEPKSIEIALRRAHIVEKGLRFSPLAGIGAPYLIGGEENLFIFHCLKAGLKGCFADITVAVHPGETTGFRCAGTPQMLRTKGAVNWITRGSVGTVLRLPLMCWREPAPFFRVFKNLVEGIRYACAHKGAL